ncbi:LAGLIDADG family homing endonuclease [Parahaliea mediterranea]|uniref:LAGLIDADG family homing endonuclease n=1 Tax=Parahaliea mediterranea TaxID=651086 RepID=UPI0019D428A5|nr:LAGLIDADG family homing endonuclease [Parahaliea mediterranea]
MVAPRTPLSLDPVDAAYVAGLIDGEGTITLIRKHRGESRQLSLSISSTEKPLLEFVLTAAGVGKITSKVRYRQHHRQSFTYAVYNRQALQLLTQVAPLPAQLQS